MTQRTRRRRSQSRRGLYACGVVVFLLVVLSLACALPESFRNFRTGISVAQAIITDQNTVAGDVFEEIEEARKRTSSKVFNDEVIDVSVYLAVFVNDDGSIVSFLRTEPPQQAFASIVDELRSKGWVYLESGSRMTGSFVKSSGCYRWVFVSCVSVSGQTSVVIQTVPIDEEASNLEEEGVRR